MLRLISSHRFSIGLKSGDCVGQLSKGVTFLAFGNGAPDIFSSVAGTEQGRPELVIGTLFGFIALYILYILVVIISRIIYNKYKNKTPKVPENSSDKSKIPKVRMELSKSKTPKVRMEFGKSKSKSNFELRIEYAGLR
ncbi:hypothetical protein TNCV_587181 [Trichonephila clavipes]|nr:hypothetical protein TNCV_587181 [Trichonephila clavipes]